MSIWEQIKRFFTEGAPTGHDEPTCKDAEAKIEIVKPKKSCKKEKK